MEAASPHVLRAARNTKLRLLADLAGKLAIVLLFAVMARELGVAGFGDFVFAVSVALLLTTLIEAGIDTIIARETASTPAALGRILWEGVLLKLVIGPLLIAAAAVIGLIGGYGGDVTAVLALVTASAFVELVTGTLYAVYQGLGDLAPEAAGRTLQTIARAALGILALALGGGIVALAAVYLLTSLVTLGYMARRQARELRPGRHRAPRAAIVGLAIASFPVAVGAVFELAIPNLTIFVLSAAEGNDAVGLFGAAIRLVDSTLFVPAALTAAVTPLLVRAERNTEPSLGSVFEASSKVLLAVLLPVSAAFLFFAEPLVELLFGSSFEVAASAVRLLAATVVLYGLSQLSFDTLVAKHRQRVVPWIAGVTAIEHLVLLALLVPSDSVDGAATATLISALTYTALSLGFALGLTGSLSWRRVLLAPLAGAVVMGAVAAALGANLAVMVGGGCAYLVILGIVERRAYPADLLQGIAAIRARAGAKPIAPAGLEPVAGASSEEALDLEWREVLRQSEERSRRA